MSDVTGAKPRMRRSVKLLLFLSLAVNLLVAGLFVGAVVHHFSDRDGRPPHVHRPGGPLTAALTREDRRAIGKAMRASMRESRQSRDEEYDAIIAALKAVPYDAETVRDTVGRQLETIHSRAEQGTELLLERLDAMSDAERAVFAERLEEELQSRRERYRKPRAPKE